MSAQFWNHISRHHGVISRAEALSFGFTKDQIDYRLGKGEWVRLAPSVYIHRAAPVTWHGRARAEALSLNGVISHRAAAVVTGLDGFRPGRIEVSVDRAKKRRARTRAIVHQTTQFDRIDLTTIDGIPVTGPARTVLDLAAVIGAKRLEQAVDSALRKKLIDWPDLYDVLVRHSRQGRDGCGKLRSFLDARYGTEVPDSLWNRLVAQLLASHGLPDPKLEHEIYDEDGSFLGRVDLAYPRHKVAIECDSVQYHLNRQSFDADPVRKNRLTLAGWSVFTLTWTAYRDHPLEFCKTIADALGGPTPSAFLGTSTGNSPAELRNFG